MEHSKSTSVVRTRQGTVEPVEEGKIRARIAALCAQAPALANVDVAAVSSYVAARIHDSITTRALDELTARTCASKVTTHPEYGVLAARVLVSDLHKSTDQSFARTTERLAASRALGALDARYLQFVRAYGDILDAHIDPAADYGYTYFGLKTLLRSYLLRVDGAVVETPQHMLMRVAVFLHAFDDARARRETFNSVRVDEAGAEVTNDCGHVVWAGRIHEGDPSEGAGEVLECFTMMSRRLFTHATPTLFNAGGEQSQLLSCFLVGVDDSIDGIYDAIKQCALISKLAGGIGIHINNIRARGSVIRSMGGVSSGIGPMCRTFEATALHVNQAGRRNGSFAMYLSAWHADVQEFLKLKRHQGEEQERARTLHYGFWVSDRFMRAVEANRDWHLFCPDECKELTDTHGTPAFGSAYDRAVAAGKARHVVKARAVWQEYLRTQIETGEPYLLFADAANSKSNQKNLGQIRSSNLCCVEGSTPLLTDRGWHPIARLEDRDVNVWNGAEFAPTTVRKTGTDEPLLHVKFSNGATLDCTPLHRFSIQEGYDRKKEPKIVRAEDLRPGMRLTKGEYPVIDGDEPAPYAYTHGLFCADGTFDRSGASANKKNLSGPRRCSYKARTQDGRCGRHPDYPLVYGEPGDGTCRAEVGGNKPLLALYGDKIALLEHLEYRTAGPEHTTHSGVKRRTLTLPLDMPPKDKVPLNASVQDKLLWLAGYFDGDGCADTPKGRYLRLQANSTDPVFLHNVMLLLQTIGVQSSVRSQKQTRMAMLPDGNGGTKEYKCNATYVLAVTTSGIQQLISLGLQTHRLRFGTAIRNRDIKKHVTVESVEDRGVIADTFCFNEPKREMGMFNGILCSNSEIIEYSDASETACCTLASISLKDHLDCDAGRAALVARGPLRLVRCRGAVCLAEGLLRLHDVPFELVPATFAEARRATYGVLFDGAGAPIGGWRALDALLRPRFDYAKLAATTRQVVRNLDKAIDRNHYPTPEARRSNLRHRPLGIGVQGLSNVFNRMRYGFDSPEANLVNTRIAATMYYAAMQESAALARAHGPYESFAGSPLSRGLFQFDLWDVAPLDGVPGLDFDWAALRRQVVETGARHSLLIALMPTASTSQILGNNECFEPHTTQIYRRETSAGSFMCVNDDCVRLLQVLDLWDDAQRDAIIANRGSLQGLARIPAFVQGIFKTAWDLSMKAIITQAAARGPYVCQSQSMNLYFERPTVPRMSSAYFHAWRRGLKTGVYYTHTRAPADTQAVTIAPVLPKTSDCVSCQG